MVEPAKVTIGSQVTIKGTGFPSNDQGTVIMDDIAHGLPFTVSSAGSFTLNLPVTETTAGSHKLVAKSPKLYIDVASTSFAVEPTIKLNPEHPEVGADVTISGNGFVANSKVAISYNNVQIASSPTSDTKGNFIYVFKVTESNSRDVKIIATDNSGNSADIWYANGKKGTT